MVALNSSRRLSNMENMTFRRVWNLYVSRSFKIRIIIFKLYEEYLKKTYHKETLPDLRPFAQDLRTFGHNWIDFGEVLDVDVGLGKDAHRPRLSGTGAAIPVAALLHNVHRIAHVEGQAEADIAMPVVDGWKNRKS